MAPKKRKAEYDLDLDLVDIKHSQQKQKSKIDPNTKMMSYLAPVRDELSRFFDAKDFGNFAIVCKAAPRNISNRMYTRIQKEATCEDITEFGGRCYGQSTIFKNQKSGLTKNCLEYCLIHFLSDLFTNKLHLTNQQGKRLRIKTAYITVSEATNHNFFHPFEIIRSIIIKDTKQNFDDQEKILFSKLELKEAFTQFSNSLESVAKRKISYQIKIELIFPYGTPRVPAESYFYTDREDKQLLPFANHMTFNEDSTQNIAFLYTFENPM